MHSQVVTMGRNIIASHVIILAYAVTNTYCKIWNMFRIESRTRSRFLCRNFFTRLSHICLDGSSLTLLSQLVWSRETRGSLVRPKSSRSSKFPNIIHGIPLPNSQTHSERRDLLLYAIYPTCYHICDEIEREVHYLSGGYRYSTCETLTYLCLNQF